MPGEGPAANGVVANGQGVAIRCRGLRKRFKSRSGAVEAVQGLDLEVRQGECFGLLGPNGAGKTTTIEILEGLQQATSGEVEVLGSTWGAHAEALRQRLGISLQETRFAEKLSVEETLALFRSFYRRGLEPEEGMRLVSLQDKRRAWVGKLSGGQKQRLAVACALVGDPDLLFLDEPTNGMDPKGRDEMLELVRDLAHNKNISLILSSHLLPDIEYTCDYVVVLDKGAIATSGTIDALKGPAGRVYEVRVKGVAAPFVAALKAAGMECQETDEDVMRVFMPGPATSPGGDQRQVCEIATASGVQVRHLRASLPTLEDVFARAVGEQ
jgi:ABC-2 type transport system ATP-binding protein